jgi:hypothetical protein
MEDDKCKEAHTPSPHRPQPDVYLGPRWVRNLNYSYNVPLYPEYIPSARLEILATYY